MSAEEFVPESADLDGLRRAAAGCRGCHLHENATQTVFSKGPVSARLVLVGEQPADPEEFSYGADGQRASAFALATLHPSAVLRARDRDGAYAGLVSDLAVAATALAG